MKYEFVYEIFMDFKFVYKIFINFKIKKLIQIIYCLSNMFYQLYFIYYILHIIHYTLYITHYTMDNFVKTINQICTSQLSINNNKDGLMHMQTNMNTQIIPYLKTRLAKANNYRIKRDEYNINVVEQMNIMQQKLNELFVNNENIVEIKLMSSLGAHLNLINDSDVDFGILVKNLNNDDTTINQEIFSAISNKLLEIGFEKEKDFIGHDYTNRYFPYTIIIDGVEFEAKIRDYDTSKTIIDLHNYLDNNLTEEQITLFTFCKFILKEYDLTHGTISYKQFKKILYEYCFSFIEGGFVFLPVN